MSRDRDAEDRRRRAADRHGDPYARQRREDEERRAEEERDDVAPPGRDDWTAPTDAGDRVRRVSAPQPLDDLLPGVVEERGWGDRLEASAVVARWEEIAGPELAQRCQAVRVAGGTLVVRATDQTWATQLRYMTSQLVDRANEVLGRDVVKRIQITVGDVYGGRDGA